MHGTTIGIGTSRALPGTDAGAQLDQAWRPWVKLLDLALTSAESGAWESAVPPLPGRTDRGLPPNAPLLHGISAQVDGRLARRLVRELIQSVGDLEGDAPVSLARLRGRRIDALALIQAAIVRDHGTIESLAASTGVDSHAFEVIGQLAAIPLLHACGQRYQKHIPAEWMKGYCPVCAAWPTIVELRGLERNRRLRCGRCASDWPLPVLQCAFCDELHHDQLGTLTPEDEPQTRRVDVCRSCKGYLKGFTTLRPMSLRMVAMTDLASVDLDLIAQEREYSRPEQSGFALELSVTRAVPRATATAVRVT
ncbi:MAG: formate dehydrogenase accessory protein FdhE [Gemmatimonadota bacterium]|nr:formate dehydrogenase accessory protein FdhE [Gemmatimonadota bacterium]